MAFVKMSKGLRSAALPAGRPSFCVPGGRHDQGLRFHRGWVGCDARVRSQRCMTEGLRLPPHGLRF